jgi:hypothetical protein
MPNRWRNGRPRVHLLWRAILAASSIAVFVLWGLLPRTRGFEDVYRLPSFNATIGRVDDTAILVSPCYRAAPASAGAPYTVTQSGDTTTIALTDLSSARAVAAINDAMLFRVPQWPWCEYRKVAERRVLKVRLPLVAIASTPLCLPLAWGLFYLRRRHQRMNHGRCEQCGYELVGNTSGICPECGLEIAELDGLSGAGRHTNGDTTECRQSVSGILPPDLD